MGPPKPTMNQQAKIHQDSVIEGKVLSRDLNSNTQMLQPRAQASGYEKPVNLRNLNSPIPFHNISELNVNMQESNKNERHYLATNMNRNLNSSIPHLEPASQFNSPLKPPTPTTNQQATIQTFDNPHSLPPHGNRIIPTSVMSENVSRRDFDSSQQKLQPKSIANKYEKPVNLRNLYSPVPFQGNQSKVSGELSTQFTTSKQNVTMEEMNKDVRPMISRNLYSPVPFQGNQSKVSSELSAPFTTCKQNVAMEEMNKDEKPMISRNLYSPVPFQANQSKVSVELSTPFNTSKQNINMEEINKDDKYNQPTNVNINLNSRLPNLAQTSQVNSANDDPKQEINQQIKIKQNENPKLFCPNENIPVCDLAEKGNEIKEPVMLRKNIYSPVTFRSHISKVKTELGIPNPSPSKNVNELEAQNRTSVNQNYNHVDLRKSQNSPLPWQTPLSLNRNQNNNHISYENNMKSQQTVNEKVENIARDDTKLQNSIRNINVPKPLSDTHQLTVRNETLNPHMGSNNIISKVSIGEIAEHVKDYEQPLGDQALPLFNDDTQKNNGEIGTQNPTYNQTANTVILGEPEQINNAELGIEEIKEHCISQHYLKTPKPDQCHQSVTLQTSPLNIPFRSECQSSIIPKSNELEPTNNYAPLDKIKEYTEHIQVRKDCSSQISFGKQVAGSANEKSTPREGEICEDISVPEEKEISSKENFKSPLQIPNHMLEARMHNQRQHSPSADIQASVDDILEKLSIAEKTELNLKLFSQLPNNIKEEVLAQHLATVPITHISSIVGRMPVESANRLIPNLFMKAADDVKLSLILDCLPKLSVEKILKDLNESEKEARKDSVRKMTRSLMSHRQ